MGRILLFCATVFLSAFLLFQVQPVIGKTILPWFGASPGVWTTCMLFFQLLLLGGYAYAHLLVSRVTPRRQALLHGTLMLVALVLLPITPAESLKPEGGDAPALGVLLVLAASVGLPYFVLSATGPLLQGWFTRLEPGRSVYRLYALSNVGSLLALLSYPFWVERAWTLSSQAVRWSIGFGGFALLAGGCAWISARGRVRGVLARRDPEDGSPPPRPGAAASAEAAGPRWNDVLTWFLLAACGSALLLATTNQMCLDVAVVPFLWVVPLALYLLSFILTFDHAFWYARPLFLVAMPLLIVRAFQLLAGGVDVAIGHQVVGYSLMLFVACMACHGELSRAKPAPRHLTFFFLVVSMGGAAGGLLVALAAPALLDDFHELPVLMAASFAVVLVAAFRNVLRERVQRIQSPFRAAAHATLLLVAGVALVYVARIALDADTWLPSDAKADERVKAVTWFGDAMVWLWVPLLVPFLVAEIARLFGRVDFLAWWRATHRLVALVLGALGCLALLALVCVCTWTLRASEHTHIARGRNFYGALAIKEYNAGTRWHDWTLRHGRIMHGFQYREHRGWPTSYYGPLTGVGLAVQSHPERWTEGRSFRIGVVGLGTGTVAAYANAHIDADASNSRDYVEVRRRSPGDVVRYYEINPLVRDWAESHFSYLRDARARGADADVVLGDARLVLERQLAAGDPQRFDVLAVDAFSSDAIPIHLLTRESFEIYLAHLAPGGVLAMHVTNRFIDLPPVVVRLAAELGQEVAYIDTDDDDRWGVDSCDWLLVTRNEALLAALRDHTTSLPKPARALWTDDFSSVFDQLEGDEEERDLWALVQDVFRGDFEDD